MNNTVMEEVYFSDDLELIDNRKANYKYPVVTLGNIHIYFNSFCWEYINTKKMRVYNTTNYVVFLPATDDDMNAFVVGKNKNSNGAQMTVPFNLRKKLPNKGYFKLYKYKDGVCIKKYEPIPNVDEVI